MNVGDKVYVDFEPSMEWAWEDKWGTLILYLPGLLHFPFSFSISFSLFMLYGNLDDHHHPSPSS